MTYKFIDTQQKPCSLDKIFEGQLSASYDMVMLKHGEFCS